MDLRTRLHDVRYVMGSIKETLTDREVLELRGKVDIIKDRLIHLMDMKRAIKAAPKEEAKKLRYTYHEFKEDTENLFTELEFTLVQYCKRDRQKHIMKREDSYI